MNVYTVQEQSVVEQTEALSLRPRSAGSYRRQKVLETKVQSLYKSARVFGSWFVDQARSLR